MPERGFLIFEFFCYRFRNFLPRVEYERNSGLKFFSLFLVLSHPVLAENNAGKGFFLFFCYFFLEFSSPGKVWTEFWTKIFFSLFRPISSPYWLKILPERGFLIFLIFCFYFFRNFLARVECERNSGPKDFSPFLGLSNPV